MGHIVIKKIDKLLLRTFVTTFILLLALVLFVLVTQSFFILFSGMAGKGLGMDVYGKLLWYIGLSVFPSAFPIAMLMTALIVFGNLSESFELTAMRSVGLSLQRTLRLPFAFVLVLSGALFYFQDYIHPTTKHKIFALVNDVWKKKSALFIQEGVFCNNIPGYSIRVDKKLNDNGKMEGIMVYDYTKTYGTVTITIAEKGKLYTTPDDGYLVMELTNGHNYMEPLPAKNNDANSHPTPSFYRNTFVSQKIRISLEALKLGNTDSEFSYDPRTRTRPELKKMIEEKAQKMVDEKQYSKKLLAQQAIRYHCAAQHPLDDHKISQLGSHMQDSTKNADFISFRNQLVAGKTAPNIACYSQQHDHSLQRVVQGALSGVEKIKKALMDQKDYESLMNEDFNYALFEKEHRFAVAIRCVIMFLLAAPLGCIIRRGGFGVSVMISFFFILLEYMLSMFGKEWVIEGTISAFIGASLANFTLLLFSFFFLIKAQQGRGLFSTDWYVFWLKIKKIIKRKTSAAPRV